MTEQELKFVLKMRDEASAALKRIGDTVQKTGDQASDAADQNDKVGTSLDGIVQNAKEAAAALAGLWATANLARGAITAFSFYEMGIIGVQKTTGMAGKELEAFTTQFDMLDRRLKGISTAEVAQLAETVGQMGVTGTASILDVTEVLAKLGVTSDVVGQQGATMVARILNLTGEGVQGVKNFGDVLNILGNASSAGEAEILNMAAGIAQATAEFGLSTEQLLGISAATRELDLNFEVTGSAIGRVLRNLRDGASTGADSFNRFLKEANLTQETFQQLMQNDPTEVLVRFAETYNKLTRTGQSAPVLESRGLNTDEIKRVFGIIGERAEGVRATMGRAFGDNVAGALDREYGAFAAAQQSQIAALIKAWETLKRTIGEALAPITEALTSALTQALYALVDVVNMLPKGFDTLVAAAIVLAPAFLAIRAAATLVTATFAALGVSFGAAATGTGLLVRSLVILRGALAVLTGPVGLVLSALTLLPSVISKVTRGSAEYTAAMKTAAAAQMALNDAVQLFSESRSEETKTAWIAAAEEARAGAQAAVEAARAELEDATFTTNFFGINLFETDRMREAQAELDRINGVLAETEAQLDAAKNAALGVSGALDEAGQKVVSFAPEDKDLFSKLVPSAEQNAQLLQYQKLLEKVNAASPEELSQFGVSQEQVAGFREAVRLQEQMAANPMFQQERGLKDQIKDVEALTGEAKQYREVQLAIRAAVEATGLSYDTVSAKLTPLLKKLQDAKSALALEELVTASQRSVDLAMAGTEAERKRLGILTQIADFEKENGALTTAQKAQLETVLIAQSQAEAYRELQGSLDPAAAATTAYEDALTTLDGAMRTGLITQQEFVRLSALAALTMGQNTDAIGSSITASQEAIAVLGVEQKSRAAVTEILRLQNEAVRSGIDLTTAENQARLAQAQALIIERERLQLAETQTKTLKDLVDTMNSEVAVLRLTGTYQNADRAALQKANELKSSGIAVTDEYTAALTEYYRALADADEAQGGGVSAWVKSVGTFKDGMATITKEGIGGLSDALTDLVTGGGMNFVDLAKQIARSMAKTAIDGILKDVLQVNTDPNTSALDRAQAAITKIESLGSQLQTPQVNISAANVALNGSRGDGCDRCSGRHGWSNRTGRRSAVEQQRRSGPDVELLFRQGPQAAPGRRHHGQRLGRKRLQSARQWRRRHGQRPVPVE